MLQQFDRIVEAPDATIHIGRFVLDLAVSGHLVEQDTADEPIDLESLRRASESRHNGKRRRVGLASSSLTPSAIAQGWVEATVGDIAECLDYLREPVNSATREVRTSGKGQDQLYPYFGATQQQGWIDDFIFNEELVLLGEDGVPFLDPLRPKAYLISGKSWVNNHAHVLRAVHINSHYLALVLNAFDYQGRVMGATRSKLNQRQMLTIPVALPPLAEQHRIVAKVQELTDLCGQLEAAKQEREVLRDALRSASLHRLTAEASIRSARQSFEFFLNSSQCTITKPEHLPSIRQTILQLGVTGRLSSVEADREHDRQPLRSVASVQNGYAFKSEWFQTSGIRLLRNVNVGHGSADWTSQVCLPESMVEEYSRFSLVEGDVVVSLDRPFISTGTKVAVIREKDLPCLLLQRVGRFKLEKERIDAEYLYFWVQSPAFSLQIDPGRSNGVPHVSSKQIESAEIVLPTLDEQRRIVAELSRLMRVCTELESALAAAQHQRSRLLESLLHSALNGTGNRLSPNVTS